MVDEKINKEIRKFHCTSKPSRYSNDIKEANYEKIEFNSERTCLTKSNEVLHKWKKLNWNYNPEIPPIIKQWNPRSYNDAIRNAADYLKKKILTKEFKENYNLFDNQAPLVKDLKEEHSDFVRGFQNRGLKYYHILKEAGLQIQDSRQKVGIWDNLNWEQSGYPRIYEEAIENASDFFLKNIYTNDFKKKYNLMDLKAPTAEIMSNDKRSKTFYNSYRRRGLHHNDIMRKAGLKLNIVDSKWETLDWNNQNIPRSYKEAVKNASMYLLQEILTKDNKNTFEISNGETPTIKELELGNKDFISAIGHRNINYNDILRYLNLKIRHDYGKWDFLNWDCSGIPHNHTEVINKASQYFLKNIWNDEFRDKYELQAGIAPELSILKIEHNDFVIACQKRQLHFRDIFKTANLISTPRNDLTYLYPNPEVANICLLDNYPILKDHLEKVNRLKGFPNYIKNELHRYPRISSFKGKLTWIRPIEKKKEFIEDLIKKDIFRLISVSECKKINNNPLTEPIYDLIRLSQDKYYQPQDFYLSHGSAGHEYVLPHILKKNPQCVGIEIPIWKRYDKIFLTGHIDTILAIDDFIIVADYKPDETTLFTTSEYSFLNSIPQVAAYGIILKDLFNIPNLLCVTFNKNGAWIYKPREVLINVNKFLLKHKTKNIEDRPWEDFFDLFIDSIRE